jgi:hypothetical protein
MISSPLQGEIYEVFGFHQSLYPFRPRSGGCVSVDGYGSTLSIEKRSRSQTGRPACLPRRCQDGPEISDFVWVRHGPYIPGKTEAGHESFSAAVFWPAATSQPRSLSNQVSARFLGLVFLAP